MKIALVTVLYNSAGVLDDFLRSLAGQTRRDFILYAVDNASPDDSAAVVTEWARRGDFPVVLIANEQNGGVAQGNNIGVRAALADSCGRIVLTNNDTLWAPDALERLLAGADETRATLVVPKICIHGTDRLWAAGGAWDRWRGGTRHRGFGRRDAPAYNVRRPVEYAPSCVMLIAAEVFRRVGLFDERYFLYYDDSDFVRRAGAAGERLCYIPESVVWHRESASVGNASPLAQYYLSRNLLLFTREHEPAFYWYYVLAVQGAIHWLKRSFTFSRAQWSASREGLRDGIRMCRPQNKKELTGWAWPN
jgi:GT2 family glycosyltransferase